MNSNRAKTRLQAHLSSWHIRGFARVQDPTCLKVWSQPMVCWLDCSQPMRLRAALFDQWPDNFPFPASMTCTVACRRSAGAPDPVVRSNSLLNEFASLRAHQTA